MKLYRSSKLKLCCAPQTRKQATRLAIGRFRQRFVLFTISFRCYCRCFCYCCCCCLLLFSLSLSPIGLCMGCVCCALLCCDPLFLFHAVGECILPKTVRIEREIERFLGVPSLYNNNNNNNKKFFLKTTLAVWCKHNYNQISRKFPMAIAKCWQNAMKRDRRRITWLCVVLWMWSRIEKSSWNSYTNKPLQHRLLSNRCTNAQTHLSTHSHIHRIMYVHINPKKNPTHARTPYTEQPITIRRFIFRWNIFLVSI